jgi:hypothetical protein
MPDPPVAILDDQRCSAALVPKGCAGRGDRRFMPGVNNTSRRVVGGTFGICSESGLQHTRGEAWRAKPAGRPRTDNKAERKVALPRRRSSLKLDPEPLVLATGNRGLEGR